MARAASERGEVVLRERVDPGGPADPGDPGDPGEQGGFRVLELRVNGVFVMDTLETSTERRLATVALAQVSAPSAVLVGGLGLGITVHEVLADARVERVVVVEVEDALVQWMRDGTVPHGPSYLADERLHVVTADITMAIAEASPATYDLVLLDVDNGPGYLVHEDNEAVYREEFLSRVADAMRPGGAAVVWSAAPAPELANALERVFGNVTPLPHDVVLRPGAGPEAPARTEQFWLYLARRLDERV